MDFLLELILQLLVQLVVEVLGELLLATAFRGAATALRSRVGRYVVGVVAGVACGWAWGQHLTGGATWPKLLWVSLALAGGATLLAISRRGHETIPDQEGNSIWAGALVPPWRWDSERLLGFVLLNLAIALGIGIGFTPA
jgi:hypothetical protein